MTEVVRSGESVDGEDMADDEGFQDEREIWEVTHVREEDLETTEGEGVDFLTELLDLVGCPILFSTRSVLSINILEPCHQQVNSSTRWRPPSLFAPYSQDKSDRDAC